MPYFSGSRAFHALAHVAPGHASAVAIVERPGDAYPTLGIAYPSVHLMPDPEGRRPAEVGWRLVVEGKELPGVWALRRGEFIELG